MYHRDLLTYDSKYNDHFRPCFGEPLCLKAPDRLFDFLLYVTKTSCSKILTAVFF